MLSIFEYNEEEELKKLRQAEFRIGKEEGREEGMAAGMAASVLLALEMKGTVPENLKERILAETDAARLEDWLRTAIKAETVEQFWEKMN